MLLVILQLCLLVLTGAGWGAWLLHLFAKEERSSKAAWFFSFIGGNCAYVLFLENLFRLNAPVKFTAWIALPVAIAGLVALVFKIRSGKLRLPPVRVGRVWPISVVLLVLFAIQGIGLFAHGPFFYYGKARYDHVNYVMLGQFVMDEPYSTTGAEMGLRPWILKAIQYKTFRLGQSVANGYISAVTLVSAKEGFGSTSLYYLCLMVLSTYYLCRSFSMPRLIAALAAAWVGFLPAITNIYLSAFFSQTIVLFAIPTIGAYYQMFPQRRLPRDLILSFILGFVFCCYTEFYAVVLAVFLAVSLYSCRFRIQVWFGHIQAVIAIGLVFTATYFMDGIRFLLGQYQIASGKSPILEALAPNAYSILGWSELFLDQLAAYTPLAYRLYVLFGLLAILALVSAFFSRSFGNRFYLAMLCVAPAAVLILLAAQPDPPKYPFLKILISCLPVLVCLVALGVCRLTNLLPGALYRFRSLAAIGLLLPPIAFALKGTLIQQYLVATNAGHLSLINSSGMKQAIVKAEQTHKANVIISREPDQLAVAWLAYHSRDNHTYLDASGITDVALTKNSFDFMKLPPDVGKYLQLNSSGFKDLATFRGPPEILVSNPQGEDRGGGLHWYWMGDSLTVDVIRYDQAPGLLKRTLGFSAAAGPSHARPDRKFQVVNAKGDATVLTFTDSADLKVPLELATGINSFRCELLEPKENFIKIPSDPRKLMIKFSDFKLKGEVH